MVEFTSAVHFTSFKATGVAVTLRPFKLSSSVDFVLRELTIENRTVRKDSESIAVLLVSMPLAFIFSHDSIGVTVTAVHL